MNTKTIPDAIPLSVTVPNPDALTTLKTFLSDYFESHKTRGEDWPPEAEYCVEYNMSTWPCGYMNETYIVFMNSEAELKEWLDQKKEWARCEDNYVAIRVWKWDLGPEIMPEHSVNVGELYRRVRR